MLEREEPYGDTFVTDVPFSRVREFKQAVNQRRSEGLYGAGHDAGILALFGDPSRYEGRDVTGYAIHSSGKVPYATNFNKNIVDWDHTEKINRVPLTEVDPRGLVATQPMVTRAGMEHYLTDTTGALYSDEHQVSNQFPAIFEDQASGERHILTGHHRATAALLKGEPLTARLVRGRRA